MSRIAVFGAGYVGLVTGACFADLGHEVVVRDILPERIERLQAGEVPIYEPGLEQVMERNRDRIAFTLGVAEAVDGAEFLYVAVGTPPTESGDADLRAVWSVVDELPAGIPGRPIVVMKSTVPVGTGENVRRLLLRRPVDGCRGERLVERRADDDGDHRALRLLAQARRQSLDVRVTEQVRHLASRDL